MNLSLAERSKRSALLERFGRWYGEERLAVAFTATNEGDDAKRVTTKDWDKARPLATADYAAGLIGERGLTRNVVIVLRPSNLVVLECDSEPDLVRIEGLGLPATVTVRSSEPYKRHYWFRPPETLESFPYVAFRFESSKLTADSGRYFLAPPSLHPSGAMYAFLPGRGPDDVDIAELPEELYRTLAADAHVQADEQRERLRVDPGAKVLAGGRGDAIFRYASMLRRWGSSREAILRAALEWNQERCEPPIERARVETQVAGAMRQEEAEQELKRALRAGTSTRSRPQPWPAFYAEAPVEHEWLVDELVPAGMLAFIAGPPKAGKTWLGLALALAVASGRPLFDTYAVPEARTVLYVALEGSRTGLRARLAALVRGLGLEPDDDELARLLVHYKPTPFDLVEPTARAAFERDVDELDPALIVVDVLRAAARFRENDAAEFAAVRDALVPMHATGRTVALLHHFGKLSEAQKERSPGERMAGTGAMYGALDVGFLITSSEGHARRMTVVLEARDFVAPDPITVAIVGEGSGARGGFTHADTATLELAVELALEERLEAAYGDGVWRTVKEAHASVAPATEANVRAALEGNPDRFVLLDDPTLVERHSTAKLYGTLDMQAAIALDVLAARGSAQLAQLGAKAGARAGAPPTGEQHPSGAPARNTPAARARDDREFVCRKCGETSTKGTGNRGDLCRDCVRPDLA